MGTFEERHRQRKRKAEIKIVLDKIAPFVKPDMRILEFGSGGGYQTPYLRTLGNLIASDIRGRIPKDKNFIICDIRSSPFISGHFNLIFANHVLEHIENTPKAFEELKRIGKTDCIYAFTVPTRWWLLLSLPAQIYNALFRKSLMERREIADVEVKGWRRFLPRGHGWRKNFFDCLSSFGSKNWHNLFHENGFEVLKMTPLLLYAPSEFPIVPTTRFLADKGVCSSAIFIIKKSSKNIEHKDKRILLINPPYERLKGFSIESIPLGLLYIATVLDKAGYSVRVYDADTDFKRSGLAYTNINRAESQKNYIEALKDKNHPCWIELKKIIDEYDPHFVGVTMMTPAHSSCKEVLKIVKERKPDVVLMAGGAHVTITGEKVMHDNPEIDYAFSGEAEQSMLEFIRIFFDKDRDFSKIQGLMYRDRDAICSTGRANRIDNLNRIPVPDRALLYNKERYSRDRLSLMVGSRGCPFSCAFCASVPLWGRKVRLRSSQNIVDEINYLTETYKVRSFGFWDDTFTSSKQRIMEFCSLIEKEYGNRLGWDCLTNVNGVDEEVLKALKRAGCNRIKIGIESGSDEMLKKIKKGITTEQVLQASRLIRKFGFWLHAYFMVGIPYATEDDLRKTIDFISRLNPDSLNLCTFTPYPGTELYDYVIDKRLMEPNCDYAIYDSIGHHSTDSFFMTNISRERYLELLNEVLKLSTEITKKLTARKLLLKAKMITPDRIKRFTKETLGSS